MSHYYVFFQVSNLFNVNYVEPHLSGNVATTAMLNSTTMNVHMNVKLVGEKKLKVYFCHTGKHQTARKYVHHASFTKTIKLILMFVKKIIYIVNSLIRGPLNIC